MPDLCLTDPCQTALCLALTVGGYWAGRAAACPLRSGPTLPSLLFSLAARPFSNLLDPSLPYPTLPYSTPATPTLATLPSPRRRSQRQRSRRCWLTAGCTGCTSAGGFTLLRGGWGGVHGWGAWRGWWRWVLAVHGCWGGRRSEVGRARVGRGGRDEGPGRRRGHSQLCARVTPEWPVCLETCENRFIVVRLHVHVTTHARRAWVR